MPAAIEVTDLRKSYGSVEAVRGVSFAVQRGRGIRPARPQRGGQDHDRRDPRGLPRPLGGEVRVLGHDPERRDRHLQERVGIVLQSSGFYPRVTVREAVSHFAKAYPAPRDPDDTITPRRARREGRRPHEGPLRRPAPPPRPRARPGRRPRADLPRRAHHGLRPGGAPDRLGSRAAPARARQDGPADHPLSRGGPGAGRPGGHRQGRRDRGRGAARRASGRTARAIACRTCRDGRRVEHQTDDPTELLHRLTRDALARGERLDGLEVTRPTLEEVYLELTREGGGRHEPDRPRLGAVSLRAQAVLAQPERRVLQLRAAAAAARADRHRVLGRRTTSWTCSSPASPAWACWPRRSRRWRSTSRSCATRACSSACAARRCPPASYLAGLLGVRRAMNAFAAGGADRGGDRQRRLRGGLARTSPRCCSCSPALGVVCFAALGVAFSHAIPNEDAAPAYTNAVFLPLIFISGVFYSSDDLPEVLKTMAEVLPLKHLIDGLSEAIVGRRRRTRRPRRSWSWPGPRRAVPRRAVLPLGVIPGRAPVERSNS